MRYEVAIPHSRVVAKTIGFLIMSFGGIYRISLFALNTKIKEFSKQYEIATSVNLLFSSL